MDHFGWTSFLGQPTAKSLKGNGAQGRDRTTDTVIFSHVLYQLSYLGIRSGQGARSSEGAPNRRPRRCPPFRGPLTGPECDSRRPEACPPICTRSSEPLARLIRNYGAGH